VSAPATANHGRAIRDALVSDPGSDLFETMMLVPRRKLVEPELDIRLGLGNGFSHDTIMPSYPGSPLQPTHDPKAYLGSVRTW
jgi:hypothetical protein